MRLHYQLQGDFVIALSIADIASLHNRSKITFREGLAGPYGCTSISYGEDSERSAYIDNETALHITIPRNDDPEVIVPHHNITGEFGATEQDVRHFFGQTGRIVLQALHGQKHGRWQ